jgi:hypothetical protein
MIDRRMQREELAAVMRHAGHELDEAELDVLLAISYALDPGMHALDSVAVTALPLESDLDPRRAPRTDAEH